MKAKTNITVPSQYMTIKRRATLPDRNKAILKELINELNNFYKHDHSDIDQFVWDELSAYTWNYLQGMATNELNTMIQNRENDGHELMVITKKQKYINDSFARKLKELEAAKKQP